MSGSLPLRIITLNIRVDLQVYRNDPNALKDNEKPWKVRLPWITKQLKEELQHAHARQERDAAPPAILLCLQEALHHQIIDIVTSLNAAILSEHHSGLSGLPLWDYVGGGREDGKNIGEISPVLFRRDIFELVRSDHTWLSETPDRPSKGWDADCIRALTGAVLRHRGTSREVAVFNTHLDHKGVVARKKSITVILDTIKRICRSDLATGTAQLPFVLTGDFNSTPEREAYRACLNSGLALDAYDATPAAQRSGPEDTFTGFEPPKHAESGDHSVAGDFFDGDHKGRIDYAWFGPRTPSVWEFDTYATLPNLAEECGTYYSDHRAVVVDVALAV